MDTQYFRRLKNMGPSREGNGRKNYVTFLFLYFFLKNGIRMVDAKTVTISIISSETVPSERIYYWSEIENSCRNQRSMA